MYFNVRNFRVQKISRISRMTPQFAKLNGREKNILANSRKLIPTIHGFQNFLVIFWPIRTLKQVFQLILLVFLSGKIQFREKDAKISDIKVTSCKIFNVHILKSRKRCIFSYENMYLHLNSKDTRLSMMKLYLLCCPFPLPSISNCISSKPRGSKLLKATIFCQNSCFP